VSSKHLTLVLGQAYPLRMLLFDESATESTSMAVG